MNNNITPPPHSQELLKQITARIEDLAQATDAARLSAEMRTYLDTFSRFHQYSLFNTWLILMACPQATSVAGFKAWQKLHRSVKKGEHGIPILAPVLIGEKDEEKAGKRTLRGFKVVYVFDLSQTEGEALPEPPEWKSPEKSALLAERLTAFAQEHGIAVTEKDLRDGVLGISHGGSVEVAPAAGTSTLIHEIAHELLHHRPDAPAKRRIRELEAEAVAFVIGRHFGLPAAGGPNYIALHGAGSEQILAHLQRIQAAAAEIIRFVEGEDSAVALERT